MSRKKQQKKFTGPFSSVVFSFEHDGGSDRLTITFNGEDGEVTCKASVVAITSACGRNTEMVLLHPKK